MVIFGNWPLITQHVCANIYRFDLFSPILWDHSKKIHFKFSETVASRFESLIWSTKFAYVKIVVKSVVFFFVFSMKIDNFSFNKCFDQFRYIPAKTKVIWFMKAKKIWRIINVLFMFFPFIYFLVAVTVAKVNKSKRITQ